MVPCFHFSHVHIVHNSILSFGKLQRRHLTKVKETCCTPFLPTNIRPQSGILIRLFIHFSRISNFRPHPVKIIIKRFQFILSRSRSTARETISRERERERDSSLSRSPCLRCRDIDFHSRRTGSARLKKGIQKYVLKPSIGPST